MAQGVSAADEQATSVNEQALTLLKRSADFIAGSRAISIAVECGFDVVQASGQKVEFGGTARLWCAGRIGHGLRRWHLVSTGPPGWRRGLHRGDGTGWLLEAYMGKV